MCSVSCCWILLVVAAFFPEFFVDSFCLFFPPFYPSFFTFFFFFKFTWVAGGTLIQR